MNQEIPRWFFLTTHAHVLLHLSARPNATAREVADAVGITERHARRVLADLYTERYLDKERVGSRNRYRVLRDAPLRHPLQAGVDIGALIDSISGALAAKA